jgi:hypothetical protein
MIFSRQKLFTSVLIVSALAISACGSSGDSDDDTLAQVLKLKLEDAALSLGDKSLLDVDFSFAESTVFDDNRSVVVAIKLPKGIAYLQDSGAVDSKVSDDDVSPVRFPCTADTGELLVFNLDDQDLRNARDPEGDADGRLRIDVQAVLAGVGTGNIEARAGYDLVVASCDDSFFGEEVTPITVSP